MIDKHTRSSRSLKSGSDKTGLVLKTRRITGLVSGIIRELARGARALSESQFSILCGAETWTLRGGDLGDGTMRHLDNGIPVTVGATAKRVEMSHLPAHGHYAPTGLRRRRIVGAALALGDLTTALGSSQLATLFVNSVVASPLEGGAVSIAAPLLLVVNWCLGLYAGRGPS